MNETVRSSEMLRLAAKYVWWTPPDIVVSEGMYRLVANVMEMGTWEDASALIECDDHVEVAERAVAPY